jgi:glycosyltransferase involved in cell wall biosynthesis
MNPQSSPANQNLYSLADEVAMLFQGDEGYGIGMILKLYATGMPNLSFVALGEGMMVDWLRANGNRVDVVPGLVRFHEGGPSLLTVMKMPAVMTKARRDADRIDALLRPRGIRLIHAHWRPQQIMAGFLRQRGYRSIWQINNTMNPRRLFTLGAKLNHRLAKWGADLLLPASDAIAQNWNGCGVRSITIRNAAIPLFSQPNELPAEPIRCVVAGRLEHLKGHHLAVAAVSNARRAGLNVCLDVYGGPLEGNRYADQLRAQITSCGCQDAIRLMGFEPRLREKHQQYHLGLQCRITPEPCSLWVCETLVDGLPLVASDSGGTPELVADGKTGLLYPAGDINVFTQKLIELASDPARMLAMRVAAFDRGQRHFTVDRFAHETLQAYETVLGSDRTA